MSIAPPADSRRHSHASALAPLYTPIFRWIWIAALVSNLGTWMQNVGAAWLMTSLSSSPLLIALVQTASTLPVFLVGIPAGVMADRIDRRKVLLWSQSAMLVASGALGVLTYLGHTGPWTLLVLTFALGLGTSINGPAWQATVPRLVPSEQLPAAVALNSVQFNLARSVGPALGGLVVLIWGPAVAFLCNAASFLSVIFVLYSWKNTQQEEIDRSESLVDAVKTGARFVLTSVLLRTVIIRTALYVTAASALWALLPVVAAQEIGSGSGGYGILLGCLGAGSVAAAVSYSRMRTRASSDRLLLAGTAVYILSTAALGYFSHFGLLCLAMLAGGLSWMTVMTTFNVSAQLTLPPWVRARALAFYIFTFQASLAIGSWIWGEVALRLGSRMALFISAASLVTGFAVSRRYRLESPATGR